MPDNERLRDLLKAKETLISSGRDDSKEHIEFYLRLVCEEVDTGTIYEVNIPFIGVVDFGTDVDSDILLNIWENTNMSDCMRLCAICGYWSAHRRFTEENKRTLEKYRSEFQDSVIFQYCLFLLYRGDDHQSSLEGGFESGVFVAERADCSAEFHTSVATTGIDLINRTNSPVVTLSGKEEDTEGILSKCAEYADAAFSVRASSVRTQTYSATLVHQNKFDEAISVIDQYSRRDHQLRIDPEVDPRHTANLPDRTSDIRSRKLRYEIGEIEKGVHSVESEIESATEHYRNQMLNFLGFFAAILAIALGSISIGTQLPFPQSAGAILVLVGGITISFGQLEALFGNSEKSNLNWESLLIGALLVAIGITVGVGALSDIWTLVRSLLSAVVGI